jgi:NADPH2:quinone reductase
MGFQFQDIDAREFSRNEDELADLLVSGAVTPHIGATYPLTDTAAALRHVADGHAIGKVIIDIGGQ